MNVLSTALTSAALLLSTAACDMSPPPDARKATTLVQEACSAMVMDGGSWWDATAEAATYAEQAAETSAGSRGFADNVADLYAASQDATAEGRKRMIQLRTRVYMVCKSIVATFPQTEFDFEVDPYGS